MAANSGLILGAPERGLEMRDGLVRKDRGGVRVLARGLALLRAFRPRNTPLTNSELAEATELPRPTVSRITATFLRLGYLEYFPERAQYRLSASVLTLGFGVLSTLDIRLRARERMRSFADQEDILVVLSVRDGMSMVCQVVCWGPGALTVRLQEGSRISLPHSAMGRAWFASLDPPLREAEWEQIRQQYPSEALRSELDAATRQIRRSGFCITVSEVEPDLMGAATVVELGASRESYVLGCAVPAFRYRGQQSKAELGAKLMMLRRQIEEDTLTSDTARR
jgi:IclR family transcriptional regulator, positive regulator for flagellar biogenesis